MVLLLLLLGAAAALDGTSLGQFMISRPLVAAALAGWVAGDPVAGLVAGGVLEILYLGVLPTGGVRFPETGPASVVAGAAAAGIGGAGGLGIAVLLGVVMADVGAMTLTALRKVNGHFVPSPEDGPVDARQLERIHRRLIVLDGFRGVGLTGLGLILTAGVGMLVATSWPLDRTGTLAVIALGLSVPLGALVASRGTDRWTRTAFIAGIAVGLLLAATA